MFENPLQALFRPQGVGGGGGATEELLISKGRGLGRHKTSFSCEKSLLLLKTQPTWCGDRNCLLWWQLLGLFCLVRAVHVVFPGCPLHISTCTWHSILERHPSGHALGWKGRWLRRLPHLPHGIPLGISKPVILGSRLRHAKSRKGRLVESILIELWGVQWPAIRGKVRRSWEGHSGGVMGGHHATICHAVRHHVIWKHWLHSRRSHLWCKRVFICVMRISEHLGCWARLASLFLVFLALSGKFFFKVLVTIVVVFRKVFL